MNDLNKFLAILLFLTIGVMSSCSTKDKTTDFEEYVFGVCLVDDSSIVQEYLNYHQNIWPEVEKGFQKAGYENIRLYRFENYVTMIVKVPKGADLGIMGQICNDSHPRVAEWNKLMDSFQKGLPGTEEGQTWVALEKYYEFEKQN